MLRVREVRPRPGARWVDWILVLPLLISGIRSDCRALPAAILGRETPIADAEEGEPAGAVGVAKDEEDREETQTEDLVGGGGAVMPKGGAGEVRGGEQGGGDEGRAEKETEGEEGAEEELEAGNGEAVDGGWAEVEDVQESAAEEIGAQNEAKERTGPAALGELESGELLGGATLGGG